jgi:hypothetical protein
MSYDCRAKIRGKEIQTSNLLPVAQLPERRTVGDDAVTDLSLGKYNQSFAKMPIARAIVDRPVNEAEVSYRGDRYRPRQRTVKMKRKNKTLNHSSKTRGGIGSIKKSTAKAALRPTSKCPV